MNKLPNCILVVTAEVDAEIEVAWNRWYYEVHLPDALACPGVLSGRRYVSIGEIWRGERFNWYRRMHLEGRGAEAFPCRGCSAWFAGIRDWEHGWLKVLKTSGDHVREVMRTDLGAEVEIFQPQTDR